MHEVDTALRWTSRAAALWSALFAAVHAYWAFGGDAALTRPPQGTGEAIYVGFIALVGCFAALVAYRLGRPADAESTRKARILARLGGVALLAGVTIGLLRWFVAGSLGEDGAGAVVITGYFLAGGILFAALGWGWQESLLTRRAGVPGGGRG